METEPEIDPFVMALAPGTHAGRFQEYLLQRPVSEALGFATVMHGSQKYGTEPYQSHLLAVAEALYELYLTKPDALDVFRVTCFHLNPMVHVLQAALLHDVLEDTETKYPDLVYRFGPEAANIVMACTKDPNDEDADLCRECSFKRTVKALKKETHAVAVKLADRLVNMRKSTQERSTHLNMYVREYPGFRKLLYTGKPEEERLFAALDEAYEAAQKRAK